MLCQKSPIPSPLLPYPPTPTTWPWHSLVLRHIKFARPRGLSFHWWPTRQSSATHAARDTSSGVLVSSYCCSTYRVACPFSSLGTFSCSSIGGPIFHPIADCEHPCHFKDKWDQHILHWTCDNLVFTMESVGWQRSLLTSLTTWVWQ
jgi:hypothetical protein